MTCPLPDAALSWLVSRDSSDDRPSVVSRYTSRRTFAPKSSSFDFREVRPTDCPSREPVGRDAAQSSASAEVRCPDPLCSVPMGSAARSSPASSDSGSWPTCAGMSSCSARSAARSRGARSNTSLSGHELTEVELTASTRPLSARIATPITGSALGLSVTSSGAGSRRSHKNTDPESPNSTLPSSEKWIVFAGSDCGVSSNPAPA